MDKLKDLPGRIKQKWDITIQHVMDTDERRPKKKDDRSWLKRLFDWI